MHSLLAQLPVIAATVGPIGSVLELLGTAFGVPSVASFGRTLESIGIDLPKLVVGVVSTVKGMSK